MSESRQQSIRPFVVTHAGWDETEKAWVLWAESSEGEQWLIPTEEATCRALTEAANRTGVYPIPR